MHERSPIPCRALSVPPLGFQIGLSSDTITAWCLKNLALPSTNTIHIAPQHLGASKHSTSILVILNSSAPTATHSTTLRQSPRQLGRSYGIARTNRSSLAPPATATILLSTLTVRDPVAQKYDHLLPPALPANSTSFGLARNERWSKGKRVELADTALNTQTL